jgi:hypothetical protein
MRCCTISTRLGLTQRKGPKLGALTSSSDTSSTASARTGFRAPGSSFLKVRAAAFRRTIVSRTSTSQGKSLSGLLDEFARLRAENLATLAAWRLTDIELALDGEHPEFGTVTLRQLLATWVVHDLGHIAQTARVMAKQYRDAIGPWRAYLPIVDR